METSPAVPLLPYQKRWVTDLSRFKAGMMSRQSGKTFSATLEIVNRALDKAAEGLREDWIILSRGERQAREALNEGVKRHLAAYGAVFESMHYPWAGAEATHHALEVELPGGSKITALPANPDTARGFSRNVLLDEFAFHMDSRRIWAAVFPVVTRRQLSIRVISTPNGRDNKFHDIITDQGGQWSVHVTDIHQAVAQGLAVDPATLRAALGDEEAWAREYELSWQDDGASWLPWELLAPALDDSAGNPQMYQGGPCHVGVDIGRKRDLWAAAVLETVGDTLWLREMATLQGESFARQEEELDRIMASYAVRAVAMDETGMGLKPVEDARVRHGSRVAGVTFTGHAKHRMATAAKRAFQEGKIKIPDGRDLLRDLGKIKKSVNAAGAPLFHAQGGSGGHADRAWALFLAVDAARLEEATMEYMSAKRPGAGMGAFSPARSGLEDF